MKLNRTIQAVLDDGLEALSQEMARLKEAALARPLIDRQAEKLCKYVQATCWMAAEERKARATPAGGDLVAQIAEALVADPELRAAVNLKLKEGRAS